MAKWEHWFWVTVVVLFQSHLGQAEEQPEGGRPPLEFIDTLTAPTLQPPNGDAAAIGSLDASRRLQQQQRLITPTTTRRPRPNHEKLTIITPSSVVVMSTPQQQPRQQRPQHLSRIGNETQDVSVSHSVSVVSVKYSSSAVTEDQDAVTSASASEVAGLKENVESSLEAKEEENNEFTQQTTTTTTTTTSSSMEVNRPRKQPPSSEADGRAPKSIVSHDPPPKLGNRLDRFSHLSATTPKPVITTSAKSTAASTTMITASTTALPSEDMTTTTTPRQLFDHRMKYEHISSEAKGDKGVTGIKRISSETAQALDELGFEYNEYMDDSDLLGDDSNDEVIPPFHEESDYFSARAIPSKSGILYQDETSEAEVATSRQSKKSPLPPHHYEPSTIVGITIGAFLLIFLGTVGLGAFIYHERYVNKPHTLDDGYSDSGGCSSSVDDSIGRVSHIDCSGLDVPTDTYCEEMYNLDNDSFLNSLETVAMPTMLWSVAPNSDSDV